MEKEKNKEEELLKKYIIAVVTLEAVLGYIVPDGCRKMVHRTLEELKNKKFK